METEKFQRKPFLVDAVRVTPNNLEEVTKWCNGELKAITGQEPYVYVRVAAPISERSKQAFVGDWVVYMSATGFKVFRHKSFKKNFEAVFKLPVGDNTTEMHAEGSAPGRSDEIKDLFEKATDEDPGVAQSIPGPNQDIIDALGEVADSNRSVHIIEGQEVATHPAYPILGNAFNAGPGRQEEK